MLDICSPSILCQNPNGDQVHGSGLRLTEVPEVPRYRSKRTRLSRLPVSTPLVGKGDGTLTTHSTACTSSSSPQDHHRDVPESFPQPSPTVHQSELPSLPASLPTLRWRRDVSRLPERRHKGKDPFVSVQGVSVKINLRFARSRFLNKIEVKRLSIPSSLYKDRPFIPPRQQVKIGQSYLECSFLSTGSVERCTVSTPESNPLPFYDPKSL